MMNGLLIMLLAINLMIILYGAGYPIPMGSTGPLIIGVIFVLLGNFLPTVRPNFFVGIRTPWTLSNEKVWRKTHRLGAKLMVSAGIVMMVSIFLPHEWEIVLCTICFVLGLGIPCVYSYWLYKKEASGES